MENVIWEWMQGNLDPAEDLDPMCFTKLPKRFRPTEKMLVFRGISAKEASEGPKRYNGKIPRLTSWTIDADIAQWWGEIVISQVVDPDNVAFLAIASTWPEKEIVVIDYQKRNFENYPKNIIEKRKNQWSIKNL